MKKIITLLLCLSTQSLQALNPFEQKIDNYIELAQADAPVKPHWDSLKQTNYIEHTGPDAEYRTRYVDLQGIVFSKNNRINETMKITLPTRHCEGRSPVAI